MGLAAKPNIDALHPPETGDTHARLDDLRGNVDARARNFAEEMRKIDEDENLSSFEKMVKKIETGIDLVGESIDRLAVTLGLKEEEIEPYMAGHLTDEKQAEVEDQPAEYNPGRIKPSQERDLPKFLRERGWTEDARKASATFGIPAFAVLSIIRRESSFDPLKYTYKLPDGRYASSARGLGQFLDSAWRTFQNAPENPWGLQADRLNPKHAIYGTAWLMARKIKDVNRLVEKHNLPKEWKIDPRNITPEVVGQIYGSYAAGAAGYIAMRRFLAYGKRRDDSDPYFRRLFKFEKQGDLYKNGKLYLTNYIDRFVRVMNGGTATAMNFAAQLEKDSVLARAHLKTSTVG